MSTDVALNDYIASLLLRYFRAAAQVWLRDPQIKSHDLDLLRMHWAISPPVTRLLQHCLSHPHEVQAVLETRLRQEDGRIRGRLDARATEIQRLVTSKPTMTVSHEPVRSFRSPPNVLLLWIIENARRFCDQFAFLSDDGATYSKTVRATGLTLEKVRRIEGLKRAVSELTLGHRPDVLSLVQSARSRRMVYTLAAEAYRSLLAIEAGDPAALLSLLSETLLGPLSTWQKWELAVGLAATMAIGNVCGSETTLLFLDTGSSRPIAKVGKYEIYWQQRTLAFQSPAPEPSEIVVNGILDAYGMRSGSDRPDIVVLDSETEAVVAVLEAKYFSSDQNDGSDAFRDAVQQIVRYARGYARLQTIAEILDKSAVALIRKSDTIIKSTRRAGTPWVFDLNDVMQQQLDAWARALVDSPSPVASAPHQLQDA